ncbi:MAG: hypothetical protein RLZ73_1219 [Bacteroidota bacterium]|jgi:hypothetical protein
MRFIKFSSLEVVIGACLYQIFLSAFYLHVFPSLQEGVILALVVWFFYLLDRQVDNHYLPSKDRRHQFHLEHKRVIRFLLVGILVAILGLLPFVSSAVLRAGVMLAMAVVLYGYFTHKGWLQHEKELCTAVLYAAGVGLVVWVREPRALFGVLALAALAYQNLCYFALLEGHSAFYTSRLRKSEWVIMGLLSGMYASGQDLFLVLPFLVTFGITFLLSRMSLSEDRRIWAELAFWSPLIYLLHGIFST